MRWKVAVFLGCFAPLTGCTTYQLIGHNLVHEPVQYEDDQKIHRRLRKDGEKLWQTVCASYPERTFSPEFKDGFLDGYADYLDSGGTAAPPIFPPVRFRRSKYYCPEGQALVRDYFAGFKYGAEVACASGQRQFLTVPMLLPIPKAEPVLNVTTTDGPPPVMPAPPPLPSDVRPGAAGDPAFKEPLPGTPLAPPKPVPEKLPGSPIPPGPGGASLPRTDEPKAPAGPRVPAAGKIRPVSAVGEPVPAAAPPG